MSRTAGTENADARGIDPRVAVRVLYRGPAGKFIYVWHPERNSVDYAPKGGAEYGEVRRSVKLEGEQNELYARLTAVDMERRRLLGMAQRERYEPGWWLKPDAWPQ